MTSFDSHQIAIQLQDGKRFWINLKSMLSLMWGLILVNSQNI